ncbi:nuclease SbcCD subunit D, partial [Kouleothrix aurantiaca]
TFLRTTAEQLDPAIPAVLTAHGTIDGATLGAERQIMLGKDLILPRSFVALPGIDYVALGHIHKHQTLGEHPPIVYAGSIERIDFGEEREDKGCVIVKLERGNTSWQFHKLAARPFVTVDVDVRNSPDPQARVLTAIERQQLTDAVVRVQIKALPDQAGLLRVDDFQQQLEAAGAFQVAAIATDIERANRGRLASGDENILDGLTPRKALELYLRAKDTPEDRIAALLDAAEELFAEQSDGASA